jgi:CRP/FNR family cyclic AMP-dependent transcriptional regulator
VWSIAGQPPGLQSGGEGLPRWKEWDVANKQAVQMLSSVPLFSECSKRELEAIAQSAKEVQRKAGSTLVKEGDTAVGFFLITDGSAEVTVRGRKRATLGPGDFFGEISLLDESRRSATVTAQTPVRMLGLTGWSFKRLLQHNPSIATKLLKVMATRLRSDSKENLN